MTLSRKIFLPLTLTLFAVPLLLGAQGVFAQTARVYITPTPLALERVGSTGTVEVRVSGIDELSAFDIELSYDAGKIRVDGLEFSSALGGSKLGPDIDNESGSVTFGAWTQERGTDGNFISILGGQELLATISVMAVGEGDAPLSFIYVKMLGTTAAAGEDPPSVEVNTEDGLVRVGAPPSGTPTPTPTSPPSGYLKLGLLKVWFQEQKDLLDQGHRGAVLLILKQNDMTALKREVKIDENGEAENVELPGIEAGTYDAFIYQAGYLTKKLAGVLIEEGSQLDFTSGKEEYFLVGDFNGDQEVNVLDFSIFVESYGETGASD